MKEIILFLIVGINLCFIGYVIFKFNAFKKRQLQYLNINKSEIKGLLSEIDIIYSDIKGIKNSTKTTSNNIQEIPTHSFDNVSENNVSKQKKVIEKVYKIIKENIAEPEFSISSLQKKLTLSKVKCYKMIKEATSMSPGELITHIKMQEALKYIEKTDMNISEIAYEVGYIDPKYFSKVFKKAYGESPSEFRKTYCKN